MIRSWSIGDIRVTRLIEYYGPTHDPATTFPEFDRVRFERHVTNLPPGHWLPEIGGSSSPSRSGSCSPARA